MVGVIEVIVVVVFGLVELGLEVLLIELFYDFYLLVVVMVGVYCVIVLLVFDGCGFVLDVDVL